MNPLVTYLRARAHIGKARAIRRNDLAAALGISVRDVKAHAEQARLAGTAVCYSTSATNGGLYLAANEQEVEEALRKLERLALSILRERSALKRARRRMLETGVQRELAL
jgi:hypothetical protein